MSQQLDMVCVESHPLLEVIISEMLVSIAPEASLKCFRNFETFIQSDVVARLLVTSLTIDNIWLLSSLHECKNQSRIESVLLHSIENEREAQSLGSEGWIYPVLRKTCVKEFYYEMESTLIKEHIVGPCPFSRFRNHYQSDLVSLYGDRPLTKRQVEILELIAQGFSAKEAARELNLSPETVRGHVKDIFARLGVRSIAQAIDVYSKAKRLTGMVNVV